MADAGLVMASDAVVHRLPIVLQRDHSLISHTGAAAPRTRRSTHGQ